MSPDFQWQELPARWFGYQDYLWFLVLLAWTAVPLAAALRRTSATRVPGWAVGFAAAQMINAGLELVLLAQDLEAPYTKFDLLLGGCSAASAVCVWAPWAAESRHPRWRWAALVALAVELMVWRMREPVWAGACITLLFALGAWGVARRDPFGRSVLFAVGVALLTAAHGPLAHTWGRGRIATDISGWAVVASLALLIGGLLAARRVCAPLLPSAEDELLSRREWRRQLLWLASWLAVGAGVIAWQGRVARRAFEDALLQRGATAAAMLDREALRDVLGPQLRVVDQEVRHYADGRPAVVLTVPHAASPSFAKLQRQLEAMHYRNLDLLHLYIAVPRNGHLLPAVHSSRGSLGQPRPATEQDKVVSFRPTTLSDLETLRRGSAYVTGPFDLGTWGDVFSAIVPLRGDEHGAAAGWLQLNVNATTWLANFTHARLLGMLLVLLGVWVWGLNFAYRIRQQQRARAEQRALAAAAADRMKSEFLAKVSHELRTPLQTLKGFGELLARASLDERQQRYVRALQAQTDVMHRVVNDLVDLGAMQAGVFRLQPGPVALGELFQDIATLTQSAARERQLEFQATWPDDLPAWVHADGIRLRQILLNLLGNALKFTPRGTITLRGEYPRDRTAGWLEVQVQDTGPGIPPGRREELFRPFTPLATRPGSGAGLGLALAHALAHAMGGELLLRDSDHGAHFQLRIPVTPAPAPVTVAPASAPSWRNLEILVVDDNTLVRELLVAFLAEHGARVRAAANGASALAQCAQHPPDVVLLDLALPDLDGLQVAGELRRQRTDGRPHIIGLSAHASARDAELARAAGMNDFLVKPVGLAQLAAAIPTLSPVAPNVGPSAEISARLEACFRLETPQVLAELRLAVEQRDWALARNRAHYLKNSADVLHLTELAQLCTEFLTSRWEEQPERAVAFLPLLTAAASLGECPRPVLSHELEK